MVTSEYKFIRVIPISAMPCYLRKVSVSDYANDQTYQNDIGCLSEK